ncbi:MAG TPA: ABC transporter permease [Acidimicrobiales bacterium]|nr:ABC transporter permease [Acidimicrobiales bacterium]
MGAVVDRKAPVGRGPSSQLSEAPAQPLGEVLRERYGWVSLLGMPVFIAAVLTALYLYVQSLELDSIEERALNADRVQTLLVQHLQLTLVSTFFVLLIAIPLGVMVTRPVMRKFTPGVLAVANIGQAAPSIGLLVILVIIMGTGFETAVYGLVAYSVLPVLRNTMVGLDQVDTSVIEAGRGMGMTKLSVLLRIELPLAVPVILAGVRTALVINVGTAALATFINGGGLGDMINNGLKLRRDSVLLTGSVLTASLALTIDYVAGLAERYLRPRGL